jgi:hypothetical protein
MGRVPFHPALWSLSIETEGARRVATVPTFHDTWDQLDQEPIKIAWKELVDHKGFELARRVVDCRLAQTWTKSASTPAVPATLVHCEVVTN